ATFTDVTAAAFGSLPVISWADWGDYDNDEDMDLVIVEGHEGIWDAWYADSTEYWLFSHFRFGEDGVDSYTFETPGEDPTARFRFNAKIFNTMVFLGPNAVNPSPAASFVVLTDSLVGAPTFTPGVDVGLYCWRESAGGPWRVEVSGPAGTFGNFSAIIETVNPVQAPADSSLEEVVVAPASPRVYRNDGGVFTEQTGALGFTPSVNPRGIVWVDFDNDGDLDLHQTNAGTTDDVGEASLMWRNDGAVFTPLSGAAWAPGSPDHFTDGSVWADYDRDGDLDMYLAEGAGPLFFSAAPPSNLFRNDGANGNSLEITLNASGSGATPIGAKATCWVQGLPVHRRVRADSWEGFQGPLSLHFGLGAAASFDSLIVVWPDGERRFIPGGQNPTDTWVVGPASAEGFVGRVAPQPAFGRQTIALDVPAPGRVRVTVHDVTGRRVAVLADGRTARPGPWTLSWDGRDESGRRVPTGVYFLRGTGDVEFSRKAVRLR
ncbi:MAG: hypothetical protein HKN12_09070, partial [Gemmatimonadetes bacterium]|nr:hypothetical protein [Gemmatimonadota bacterium]